MNLPTKITVSRIIATIILLIALFVLYIIKNTIGLEISFLGDTPLTILYLVLFLFFVLASYTDHLDGKLARKNNQVTELGKFLDPIADKLLINSFVIFLAIPNVLVEGQMTFSFWCAILLIARDTVVDALRFIAAQRGKVIAANIFGKAKTVLEMIAVGAILLNGFPFSYFDSNWGAFRIANIFVYLATIMSLISGFIYVKQNIEVLKEDKDNNVDKEVK